MQPQTKTVYDYNTGKALQPGEQQSVYNIKTGQKIEPITLDQLKPATPVNIPPEKPVSPPAPITLTPVEQYMKQQEDKSTKATSDYEKILEEVGLKSKTEQSYREDYKAPENLTAYTGYSNQLAQEQRTLDTTIRNIERNNPGGTFGGAMKSNIDNLTRDSLQKQADIAILGNAALNNYNAAIKNAKDKVDLEFAPLEAKLAYKKEVADAFKTELSKAEYLKVQSLFSQEEKKIEEDRKDRTAANTMYVNALQSKAPQSLIDKAKSIIDKGGSSLEVAKVLGNYSMSEADRLSLQLQKAQISNTYSMIKERNATAKAETATQAKERQDKEKVLAQKNAQIPIVKEKIDLVNQIINSKGMNSRVGPNGILPTRKFLSIGDSFGAGQDFAGAVHQLTNQDTLNQLLELKAAGGTLGAVSEKELDLLQKAASKINDWENKDKNRIGKGTWNIDEKRFKEELNIVLKSSKALYEDLGGATAEQDNLSGFLDIVDGALQSSENIYQSSGYNL